MAESSGKGPWWRQRGCIGALVLTVVVLGGGVWLYFSIYQGRDISRFTGVPVKITLPDCIDNFDQVVSISFHSNAGGEVIKDVTYICDGRLFSQEFNDFGILQGSAEWILQK